MKKCRTRSNAHVNGILTMQMMGLNKCYTMDVPQWRVCDVKFSVHGITL